MAAYPGRGVHGRTVEELGGRIVSGRIAEGQTLDFAALGAELDVSLTALREALKVLAAKGLVDARQKRGTFVTDRSRWNLLDVDVMRWEFESGGAQRSDKLIEDLAQVRTAVEPACARAAAEHRTEGDLTALEEALAAMADWGGDPGRAVEADLAFHRAVLAATHNELFARMDLFFGAALAQRDRLVHAAPHQDPVPVHRAVLEAIRARDPEAAETAVRELLDQSARDAQGVRSDPTDTSDPSDPTDTSGAPAPSNPGAGQAADRERRSERSERPGERVGGPLGGGQR